MKRIKTKNHPLATSGDKEQPSHIISKRKVTINKIKKTKKIELEEAINMAEKKFGFDHSDDVDVLLERFLSMGETDEKELITLYKKIYSLSTL